jgi:hypothetical protein
MLESDYVDAGQLHGKAVEEGGERSRGYRHLEVGVEEIDDCIVN